MKTARSRSALAFVALALVARRAAADAPGETPEEPSPLPPSVEARADHVSFAARENELFLRGRVRVDSPPFYLSSDELEVRRTRYGAEVRGRGKLAFCPCLGTPLAVGFDGATVAPPEDVFVQNPTLLVYDVPVLWLPFVWLRSPGRIGLLPPVVEYRGADGMLLGGGVHLPWTKGDADHGVDVRGAGYTTSGATVDVQSRTAATLTRVRWDRLRGDDGLTLDARGAFALREASGERAAIAWQADAIRGARGVSSTTELDAAARPFDRAAGEASWRRGPVVVATGVRAVAVRGEGPLELRAAGPVASARVSDGLGEVGVFDATVDGGQLRGENLAALTYARAEGGTKLATRVGPLGATLSARGAGDVADGADSGPRVGTDGAAEARAELALPLVAAYDVGDPADPIRHLFEPRVAAGALAAHDEGVLGVVPGRGLGLVDGAPRAELARGPSATTGAAWFAEGTIYNAFGRWARRGGSEMEASFGAVGDDTRTQLVARWRGATTSTWIGSGADVAHVFAAGGAPSGAAAITRYRVGKADGVHLAVLLAMREGVDPVRARVLTDAPLEPSSGFLSWTGWTGGARVAVPWTRGVVTGLGADGDLTHRELLAARASIELRDRCGCLVVRAFGAHRLGRPGADVGLTVDFVAPSR